MSGPPVRLFKSPRFTLGVIEGANDPDPDPSRRLDCAAEDRMRALFAFVVNPAPAPEPSPSLTPPGVWLLLRSDALLKLVRITPPPPPPVVAPQPNESDGLNVFNIGVEEDLAWLLLLLLPLLLLLMAPPPPPGPLAFLAVVLKTQAMVLEAGRRIAAAVAPVLGTVTGLFVSGSSCDSTAFPLDARAARMLSRWSTVDERCWRYLIKKEN